MLGIYAKKTEYQFGKILFTPMFTGTLFTIAEVWKQPKHPSVRNCRKYAHQWNDSEEKTYDARDRGDDHWSDVLQQLEAECTSAETGFR